MGDTDASNEGLEVGWYAAPHVLARLPSERRALVERAERAGVDHLFVGDHVSFHDGFGMDGLIDAASLAAQSDTLKVIVGVYLLALRHPVPVARQIASLGASAPGRLVLGVGLGGEDPHEMEICGVDPKQRGRATNHALEALRLLLAGTPASYECEFFSFRDALIRPAPRPAVPIVIGGRSEAALRRAARLGDGWLGIWCSARRYGEVVRAVAEEAARAGRGAHRFRHGLQVWVGFGDAAEARERLARTMREMYQLPFEPFEKYSPLGTPETVAEFLAPYVDAGARTFNLACRGESAEHEIDCVAEVRARLRRHAGEEVSVS